MNNEFEVCLADYECVLPALAKIIGAQYTDGDFTQAEDTYYESHREESQEWELVGKYGRLRVLFEQHEGYLFGWLQAQEPQFKEGKQLLWNEFNRQSGGGWPEECP